MDLEKICLKKIAPRAEKLDWSRRALKRAFRMLGRKRLLALQAPPEKKGRGYTKEEYFVFVEMLQSYSGALGFLQRQHQAAGRLLEGSPLYDEWIPGMAKGRRRVGVAVYHARRLDKPTLVGTRAEGGYFLNGTVHWVSGYKIFNHLVVAFFTGDQEGMALVPFKRSKTLTISAPAKTISLYALQTVSLTFKGTLIPDAHLISLHPKGTFAKSRPALESQFASLSALALACKRLLAERGVERYHELVERYERCRSKYLYREEETDLLELYGTMYKVARDFLEQARFSFGAKSMICPNIVERLEREFLLFGVILTSPEVVAACTH